MSQTLADETSLETKAIVQMLCVDVSKPNTALHDKLANLIDSELVDQSYI